MAASCALLSGQIRLPSSLNAETFQNTTMPIRLAMVEQYLGGPGLKIGHAEKFHD